MTATASDQWFWADWMSDPGVRMSSPPARALWMDMLCVMAASPRKGFLLLATGKSPTTEQLARIAGMLPQEVETLLTELVDNSVCSKDRHRTIYCRRMVRDTKRREASQKGGKIGGRSTYEKQKGIFGTQHTTQHTTQHPRRAPKENPVPIPVTTTSEEPSTGSPRTAAGKSNPKSDANGSGNGAGRKAYEAGTTTLPKAERLARFQASIAKVVPGGWVTVASAVDHRDHNHKHSLEACKDAATSLNKGWPNDWPQAPVDEIEH